MRKVYSFLSISLLLMAFNAWGDNYCSGVLPQVSVQLSSERWVITHTAKVSVSLDALLNKEQLAHAQENFQAALKRIAPDGDWHITEFSRNPSKTNLEQLHALAEARLSDAAIAGIRERAGKQSSDGQTYTVQDITYSPSAAEIAAVQAELRADIYNQVQAELNRLNTVYPKADYRLYNINFLNGVFPGAAMGKFGNEMIAAAVTKESPRVALSQKMTQQATVLLAAPPGALCQKSS